MANLLDWNTLDHKVKAYLDEENGIDTEQKAFPILMVASLLGVSDEEAEDSITDGSKDRGVDAVFIDDRDGRNAIHVFQFKYVNTFENTKKNFPSGEIDKLVSFFDDVLDLNKSLNLQRLKPKLHPIFNSQNTIRKTSNKVLNSY